jgi:hypothetical protein
LDYAPICVEQDGHCRRKLKVNIKRIYESFVKLGFAITCAGPVVRPVGSARASLP